MGQTIVITRNGVPVAELRPVPPRRFVARAVIADAARPGRMPQGCAPISMPSWTRRSMAETAPTRGLLDTRNGHDFAALGQVLKIVEI